MRSSGLVVVAGAAVGAARLVGDGAHKAQDALAVFDGVLVDGFRERRVQLGHGVDVAGLAERVAQGDHGVRLLRLAGEHHLAGLVDDADVSYLAELAQVVDDGLGIFAGVEHHGVMQAELEWCSTRGPRP